MDSWNLGFLEYDRSPFKQSNSSSPLNKSNNEHPFTKSNNQSPLNKSNNESPVNKSNNPSLFKTSNNPSPFKGPWPPPPPPWFPPSQTKLVWPKTRAAIAAFAWITIKFYKVEAAVEGGVKGGGSNSSDSLDSPRLRSYHPPRCPAGLPLDLRTRPVIELGQGMPPEPA